MRRKDFAQTVRGLVHRTGLSFGLLFWLVTGSAFASFSFSELPETIKSLSDLNHNGRTEIGAIQNASDGSSRLVVWEVDSVGQLQEIWSFALPGKTPGHWQDFTLADMNLNGRPELIAVARWAGRNKQADTPWLFFFEWQGQSFSPNPDYALTVKRGRTPLPRPSQILAEDFDGDGLMELALSLGAPEPSIQIWEFRGTYPKPILQLEFSQLPPLFQHHPETFLISTGIADKLPGTPILALQSHRGKLYLNQLNARRNNSYFFTRKLVLTPPPDLTSVLTPKAFVVADLDHNDQTDLLIGTQSGDVFAPSLTPLSSKTDFYQEENVSLEVWHHFKKKIAGLEVFDRDGDGNWELFLQSGNTVYLFHQESGNSFQFDDLSPLNTEFLPLSARSLPVAEGLFMITPEGETALFPWSGLTRPTLASGTGEVDILPSEEPAQEVAVSLPAAPVGSGVEAAPKTESVTSEAPPPTIPTPPTPRPDVIIHAGEAFKHPLPRRSSLDPGQLQLHFASYPPGAQVSADLVLSWTPTPEQLGYYKIAYTYADIDTTFWLYVNDPPRILSQPETVVQVGHQYNYRLEVRDANPDARLSYKVLKAPLGLKLSPEGQITWQPTDDQLDTQYVELQVSDGFDSTKQHIAIYVNAPPSIIAIYVNAPPSIKEKPATVAFVGQLYQSRITFTDPNKNAHVTTIPIHVPSGMRFKTDGTIEWQPAQDQVGFHDIVFTLSDDIVSFRDSFTVFVNAPPKIVSQYPTEATVGIPWHYSVEVQDPNDNQDLTYLVTESTIPEVSITQRGSITWTPTEAEVDQQSFVVSVSDGLQDAVQKVTVFVNSIPRIVSTPETLATAKQVYQTQIRIEDLNHNQPHTYKLKQAPAGMKINRDGLIRWRPRPTQKGYQVVVVEVSDGLSSALQKFQVFVNVPPEIKSKPPLTAVVDKLYRYPVVATDENSEQELKYKLVKAPQGASLGPDHVLLWKPTAKQINKQAFQIEVSDGLITTRQSFQVFVNSPPVVTSKPAPVALAGETYTYRLVAEDPNKDAFTVQPVELPEGAKYDPKTGTITWLPLPDQQGANEFLFKLQDKRGLSTNYNFQVHVFLDPHTARRQISAFLLTMAGIGALFVLKTIF